MSKLFTLMAAMLVSSASAGFIGKLVSGIVTGFTNDIGSVKQVVDKTVVAIGSSQCSNLKDIFGINEESYVGEEPNLKELTINYITNEMSTEIKLDSAAELLPQNYWFNASLPLIIYFHGFTDNPEKESYTDVGEALLSHGKYNVVALDASSLIRFLYLRASTLVEFIGEEFAKMLAALYEKGLNPEDIHLIGHSLGSHIAGFTGKKFFELTGRRIGRISGLDPAGPCFSMLKGDGRLSKDHADFVFVMHTDMGVYGLDEQIGHVDFYPNGGYQQPKCILQTCSHSRAWQLFAESVRNLTAFYGISCPDYQTFRDGKCDASKISIMGFLTSPCETGKFYLETNDKSPYGLGKLGVIYGDDRGAITRIFNKIVVNERAFIGVSCPDDASFRDGKCDSPNTSIMGFACPPDAAGKYYLRTNDKSPYGLGEAGVA